jgi:flagellar biosynthesis/type III secretory pathway M-ring protein FliF/YscJ
MDAGVLLLLFCVLAAVAYVVLAPLRNPPPEQDEEKMADRLADLELRKETKYAEIRDAEADFHAGKLSPEDHRELDRVLRREAIGILEQIDRVNERPHGDAPGQADRKAAQENGRPS